jgi:hypothetical protein
MSHYVASRSVEHVYQMVAAYEYTVRTFVDRHRARSTGQGNCAQHHPTSDVKYADAGMPIPMEDENMARALGHCHLNRGAGCGRRGVPYTDARPIQRKQRGDEPEPPELPAECITPAPNVSLDCR